MQLKAKLKILFYSIFYGGGILKKLIIILILMCLAVINALWGKVTPLSAATIDTFLWGSGAGVYSNGDFTDAEKSGTAADNLLCWAAAAANVLAWGGWDGGVGNEDAVFGEFKDYWTNDGSWSRFGWEWWFTGNVGNAISPDVAWNTLGLSGSQFDNTKGTLDSADDFSPHFTLQQYQDNVRTWEIFGTNPDLSDADNQIFGFIDDGYGTALQLIRVDSQGTQLGAHAVTLWGYRATDGLLDGIYISDSDNNEGTAINNYSYYSVLSMLLLVAGTSPIMEIKMNLFILVPWQDSFQTATAHLIQGEILAVSSPNPEPYSY